MKITKVNYQKSFITAPFLQEKIGFEAEVDTPEEIYAQCGQTVYQDELAAIALSKLKKMAEDWHKKSNPHLHQETMPSEFVPMNKEAYRQTDRFMPEVAKDIPTISKDAEKLEIAIDNAQSLAELQELKGDCWKHGLSTNYIMKFNELNNGRPSEFTEGLG